MYPQYPGEISGFLRLPQVLKVIPVSKSVWWKGIETGIYPPPFKFSARISAWRVADIKSLVEKIERGNVVNETVSYTRGRLSDNV